MKSAAIISCMDNYDYNTRTKYVSQFLSQNGFDVVFIVADFDHRNKRPYRADRDDEIKYIHVPKYKKNISLKRLWSHISFGKKVGIHVSHHKYDLVYYCAPPNCAIKELGKCKKQKDFMLITEIGDMWPETMPVSPMIKRLLHVPLSFWASLRDKNLILSDCVIAECNLFKEKIIENSHASRVETIYFCKTFRGRQKDVLYKPGDVLRLCYLGSVNNIIDIELICKLLRKLSAEVEVEFHIIGDGENRNQLIEAAGSSGAVIRHYGAVYDEDKKQEIFDHCHYALNIMKDTVCVGMTMKSLDYFSYGIPMINNIGADISEMIDKFHLGFNMGEDSLSICVSQILSTSEAAYKEMCENVKNSHARYFSVDVFERKLRNILEESMKHEATTVIGT